MVSIQQPLIEGLAHVHFEEPSIAGIDNLYLACASGWQKLEQYVALLHQDALKLVDALTVKFVRKQDDLLLKITEQRVAHPLTVDVGHL